MKRALLSLLLFLVALNGFAQKGYGVDGTIGVGYNGGDQVYQLLLEGRVQFNDFLSTNLGLGLWNSGFKGAWQEDIANKSTLYNLSSNKTLPSLQLGVRGQFPVFAFNDRSVRFFAEPKLYFLPFSGQTVNLKEFYYDISTEELTGDKTYQPTSVTSQTSLKSASTPRLYGGLQLGLSYKITETMDLAVSYGYTRMDLFRDLRDKSVEDHAAQQRLLNPYLPQKDIQQLSIGFLVNFDLN